MQLFDLYVLKLIKYCKIILDDIKKQKNITLIEDEVVDLIVKNQKCLGVKTQNNGILTSKVTIMTTGVYMNARILRGENIKYDGPDGEKRSSELSNNLKKYGFENLPHIETKNFYYDG